MNGDAIRVLLVEDDLKDAQTVREMLAKTNHSSYIVEYAERVSTGLSHLQRRNTDILLLDLNLPDSKGLDTVKQVLQANSGVPVVVMNAPEDEELAKEAVARGVQDYLIKGKTDSLLLTRTITHAIQRKKADQELQSVNRALKTVSECNQVLVQAPDEASLLNEICRILTTTGGYRMAWVGYAEQDKDKSVCPVAQAGYEEGYLKSLAITWAETEKGMGPTGTAIRTGSVVKNIDSRTDPNYIPWRSSALARGYASSIALPLTGSEGTFGALNIYAREADAFDDQEEGLLRELASNLAYGIQALRAQSDRSLVQKALQKNEEQYRVWLDNIIDDVAERKKADKVHEAMYKISQTSVAIDSLEELYKAIHTILADLMPVDNYYIALYDPATDLLSTPYFVDQFDENSPPQKPGRGLTEYVLRTGKALLASPEVFAQLVDLGEVELVGTNSIDWLGVPLKARGRVIGVMVTQSYTEGVRFSSEDKDLLEFVSTQVALAIDRKRTEIQMRQSAARAEALVRTAARLNAQLDLKSVLKAVCEEITQALHMPAAWLDLYNKTHSNMEYAYSLGLPSKFGINYRALPVNVFQDYIDKAGPLFVFPDVKAIPNLTNGDLYNSLNIRTIANACMLRSGVLVGVLRLVTFGEVRQLTEDELALLQGLSDQAAQAIANARLFEQEQSQAKELAALYSISAAMRKSPTMEEMLPAILREVRQLLKADAGMIVLQDQNHADYQIVQADGQIAENTGKTLRADKGILEMVLHARQPYMAVDYNAEPDKLDLEHTEGIGPAVFVPLESEVELLGVLMAARLNGPGKRPFSESETRVLATVGEIAGNSLRRVRLYEEAQSRLSKMQALREIDMTITSSLDMNISFEVILEQVTTQMKIDAASVLLLNSHTQTLDFIAGRGFQSNALRFTHLRIGEGYAGQAAQEQRVVNIPDLRGRRTDFLRSPLFGSEGFVSYYAVPLIAKGTVKGVLEIFHRDLLTPGKEWLEFLEALAGQAAIAIDNATLFSDLQRSNEELIKAYDATIEGWSFALDLRDKETEGHTQRVAEMTLFLARAMGVSEAELVHIRRGALLHDIGKVGIPDHILLKPGPLTTEEWVVMRKHPVYAFDMLAPIAYLQPALDIPYCHHEKWDGSGYPRGLIGAQIPLAARIFAAVDVWDALCSERPYSKAWNEDKVLDHIRLQSGKHFDPQVVDMFLKVKPWTCLKGKNPNG
jgi:response regulator RpfG family c-di-GMP phosphodiesterase